MGHFQRATARAHTQKCSGLESDPSLGPGITLVWAGRHFGDFLCHEQGQIHPPEWVLCKSGVYTQNTQPVPRCWAGDTRGGKGSHCQPLQGFVPEDGAQPP